MKSILFYEWSDINRQPICFKHVEDFLNFCNSSNIKITKKNCNFLNDHNMVYSTCKVGKNELIMSDGLCGYRNFRKNCNKHRNG